MSEKEKTPEEIEELEKSRNSWRTWGIISIIGAVFCFIVAVLLLIFIFKYRNQLSNCRQNISESFKQLGTDMRRGINSAATFVADATKIDGGCGACAMAGGCGACDMAGGCGCDIAGGCGCDMTGGAANSSSFLNKLLKKK